MRPHSPSRSRLPKTKVLMPPPHCRRVALDCLDRRPTAPRTPRACRRILIEDRGLTDVLYCEAIEASRSSISWQRASHANPKEVEMEARQRFGGNLHVGLFILVPLLALGRQAH